MTKRSQTQPVTEHRKVEKTEPDQLYLHACTPNVSAATGHRHSSQLSHSPSLPPPTAALQEFISACISCQNGLSRKVYFYQLVYKLRDLVKLTSLPFTEVPKVQ